MWQLNKYCCGCVITQYAEYDVCSEINNPALILQGHYNQIGKVDRQVKTMRVYSFCSYLPDMNITII
jgi:hypothetical protein